jgi:hypothetical protein
MKEQKQIDGHFSPTEIAENIGVVLDPRKQLLAC